MHASNSRLIRVLLVLSSSLWLESCSRSLCPKDQADRLVRSFAADPGHGDPEVFAACLAAGGDPSSTTSKWPEPEGWTPLLLTAFGNFNDASRQPDDSIWNKASLEQAQLLLEHGADVFAKSPEGENVVYLSSVAGRVPLIRFFLSKGVSVDEATRSGKTPLLGSITYARTDVVDLLLQHGANPNHIDNEGHSALDLAESIKLAAEQSGAASGPGYNPAGVIEILKRHGGKTATEIGRAP